MATIDTRKLKDQTSEFLGKGKYDKASEMLEQLVRLEPKDMQHRLKLGDTYRRMGANDKAINAYQIAGRHFGDEGQLIKAIAAFKVIVEIDPKNDAAQRELLQMNTKRFAKPVRETPGLKAPKGIGAGARGTSDLELAAGEKVAAGITAMFEGTRNAIEMSADDDEPLELDTPASRPPIRAGVTSSEHAAGAFDPTEVKNRDQRRGPPPKIRPAIEIGAASNRGVDLTPIGEPELDLSDGLDSIEDGEEIELDAPVKTGAPAPAWRSGSQAGKPPTPPPPEPKAPPVVAPSRMIIPPPPGTAPGAPLARIRHPPTPETELDPSELIDLDPTPTRAKIPDTSPGVPSFARGSSAGVASGATGTSSGVARGSSAGKLSRPIADLLADGSGEEIELISISSGDSSAGIAKPPPPPDDSREELDAAFAIAAEDKMPAAPPPPPPRKTTKVPLFDDLPQAAFIALVNRLTYKRWQPGEVILKEGDPGRSFFVIVEGKVRVYKNLADGTELRLATLGEGAFFGEMALLSGAPRAANVVAEEETELLEISDQMLREIVGRYPSVAQSLKIFYRQRLVNNVMAISPMFKEFDPSERRSIVERFKMKQVAAGDRLIKEDENSDGLYVVLHGSVRVVKRLGDGRPDVELARLKEGELFGEMSLLNNEPATATVTAAGPTILLKLPRDQFQELILTHPQILEMVSDLTDKRKREIQAVLSGHGPGHDGMSFV